MNGYGFLLGSSVGKKILLVLTGLCLIGFPATGFMLDDR